MREKIELSSYGKGSKKKKKDLILKEKYPNATIISTFRAILAYHAKNGREQSVWVICGTAPYPLGVFDLQDEAEAAMNKITSPCQLREYFKNKIYEGVQ